MTSTVSARDRIHVKYCRDPKCGTDFPGDDCKNLDYLLDMVEEQTLHRKADEFRNEARMYKAEAPGARSAQEEENYIRAGGVMAYAAQELDPYQELPDGSLVRKADGTPVPGLGG